MKTMKTCRWLPILCAASCFLTVGVAHPRPSHAGFFPDVYWALFGPPGTPYFAGYRGYYGGGPFNTGFAPRPRAINGRAYRVTYYSTPGFRTSTSYYGGGFSTQPGGCARPTRTFFVPASPCQPCPVVCDPCAVGGSSHIRPAPGTSPGTSNGNGPRTFRKPESDSNGTGSSDGTKPPIPDKDDSEFKSRDDTKKFKPTRDEKKQKDESPFKLPGSDDGNGGDSGFSGNKGNRTQRKALKPNLKDNDSSGPIIRKNKPAPPKPPVEDDNDGKSDEPSGPKIDLPNLDAKITWKPTIRRTRQIIRPVITRRQLTRSTVDPNAGWKPVRRGDVGLVKK